MGFSWGQLLFLSLLVSLTNAHRHEYQYCLGSDNYHTGIYEANRLTLLSSLGSSTDKYGFYSSSFGENSETVYALVLCRGDIELTTCRSCINSSTGRLIQACPNSKAAFRGNDFCMLRYSTKAMKGIREDNPRKYFVNNASVPSADQFNQSLRTLLDSLRGEAASGGSRRKFAANETKVDDSLTIYGYMQCMPDLLEHDCDECLRVTTQDLWGCCNGTRKGVTVYKPSCVLRYETFPFLAEISSDEPGNPPGNGILADAPGNEIPADVPENRSHTNQTAIIIAFSILSITFLLIALACSFLLLRKKQNVKRRYNSGSLSNLAWIRSAANLFRASRQNGMHQAGEDETQSQSMDFSRFDFAMVRAATNDFSNGNKLGGGGFGSVYKGQLPNGQEIAVKRLANGAKQGQIEFKNEIVLLARLQHKNLVRLLGFCLEGEERLLVYEFVPNASLDHFIFGIVEGLVYLHQDSQLRIIHHDLKAGNVLLNREMNPKIADFGLARLFLVDQSRGNTKKIGGTMGYMPPEYAQYGQFSVKTDVFSFGVLVLEIVSGRKNNGSGEHLISYAWKKWRQGKTSRLIDQTLRGGSESEKMRCIHIGLLCVQENVVRRPTMASVALMLNSFSMSLPVPSKPAFLMQNSVEANTALPEKFPSRVTSSDQSLEHTSPDQSLEFSVNPFVNNEDSITLPR